MTPRGARQAQSEKNDYWSLRRSVTLLDVQERDDMSMTGGFVGKVAFGTGTANGIGRAAALAFAREGARMLVANVSKKVMKKQSS